MNTLVNLGLYQIQVQLIAVPIVTVVSALLGLSFIALSFWRLPTKRDASTAFTAMAMFASGKLFWPSTPILLLIVGIAITMLIYRFKFSEWFSVLEEAPSEAHRASAVAAIQFSLLFFHLISTQLGLEHVHGLVFQWWQLHTMLVH